MERFQIVVIGAGPGGYVAAIKAAQLGLSCAVVEVADVGGTCLNRGCIPAKTILHAAELIDDVSKADLFGVEVGEARVNWEALRERTQAVSAQLCGGVEKLLSANGVTLVRGRASIGKDGVITVACPDGSSCKLAGDDVIIAAGSQPALPPILGIDLPGVINSDDVLPAVPQFDRLAVIGGGVIGCEIASAYADFDCEVTVLEMESRLLPTMDREFGQSLGTALKKRGVRVEAGAAVQSIEQTDGALRVSFERRGASNEVIADAVLVATGRRCDVNALFVDGDAPDTNRGRIVVDEKMRTSREHFYAIGDIADAGPQLAHAASAQGVIAVCAIAGEACEINLASVPSCVYTSPEIASVGMTEAEAKEQGIAVRTGKYLMAGNGKTIISDLDRGFVKIVADESTGRVLGAQLLCGRASDIIGELAVAVGCELSVDDLTRVVHPHPTFVEGVGEAVEAFGHGSIHAMPRKR